MRKIITSIILIAGLNESFSQVRTDSTITSEFNKEYLIISNIVMKSKKIPVDTVNNIGNKLMALLIEMETPTQFERNISSATRQLIATKNEPYVLVLLERAINEDTALSSRVHLKEKLLKEISIQVNLLSKEQYPYYSYGTKQKQLIRFISIRSGNDLFTLAGLYDQFFFSTNKYWKDGGTFFQRNDDRDYTGSFLIEIGTDYLRTLRRRPLKTYQTLLFGFDVYTPYFKDSIIFSSDTSYNILDRPHASFQYFGWSKKGISRQDRYKWSTTIKFGKIGGNAGARFQNALHQDISYSRRPRGWGAQIANGGRIGFSLELKQEFFPWHINESSHLNPNAWRNLHASVFTEEKIGTYMTTGGLGIQLSNKKFAQTNHNFINHRIRQTVFDSLYRLSRHNFFHHFRHLISLHHFMYNISFSATYVKHNTMLEGYGIFNSREEDNDVLTPASRYYLKNDKVRRINYVLNTTVSYTTRFGTIFYNWKSISPETKFGNIGINSPASGKEMNISKRWHHFAEIGFTFNTH